MSDLSDGLIDIGSDIAEPMFDSLSIDLAKELFGADISKIAGDTPGIKILLYATKVFNSGVHACQVRKLQSFLEAVKAGQAGLDEFEKLNVEQKQDLRAFVISELDKQTSEKQAEALGYLVVAHLRGGIRKSLFQAVAHEIKNTNPLLYESFNELPYKIEETPTGLTYINGPIHYLPSSFTNPTSDVGFSGHGTRHVMTNLGQLFFLHIYNPMAANFEKQRGLKK